METTGVQRREGSRWVQAQERCHGNTGAELECRTQAQGKNTGNRSTERKESRGKVVAGRQKESNLLKTRTRARDVVQWYKTCLACLTACKALCLIPSTTKIQNPETEDRTRESRGGCNCMSQ